MTNPNSVPHALAYNDANAFFFEISEESDWMVLNVDCGPPVPTWNVYILRDPQGKVRYQHLDVTGPRTVTLHRRPEQTSLNAVAGPITAGRWRLDYAHLPPVKVYTLCGNGHVRNETAEHWVNYPDPFRDIWAEIGQASCAFSYSRYQWDRPLKEGSRWYRGDCHVHCTLSDGSLSPEQLTRQAQDNGLDFLIVTDHLLMPTSWPRTDLLVIPGIEVTTVAGHWNALGPRHWFDWHPSSPDGGMTTEAGQNRVISDARQAGALCVINHARHEEYHWTFHQTPLNQIDALEVINWPQNRIFKQGNHETMAIWNTLWNDGYTVPGIAGSDFHHNTPSQQDGESQQVGDPSTYVYSNELSAAKILNGIRQGNTYVSRGPQLTISISVDGKSFIPGDDLTNAINTSSEGVLHYRISVSQMESGDICWVEDGETVEVVSLRGRTSFERCFTWKERDYAWARLDIRSADGDIIAFVNPVFCGSKTPSLRIWAEAVARAGLKMQTLKEPGAVGW